MHCEVFSSVGGGITPHYTYTYTGVSLVFADRVSDTVVGLVFDFFDPNGDGSISSIDFKRAMTRQIVSAGGSGQGEEQAPPLDSHALLAEIRGQAGRLNDMFHEYDADQSGVVNKAEFKKAMRALVGDRASVPVINSVFGIFAGGKTEISLVVFRKAMKG